jgi:hypothetical protein
MYILRITDRKKVKNKSYKEVAEKIFNLNLFLFEHPENAEKYLNSLLAEANKKMRANAKPLTSEKSSPSEEEEQLLIIASIGTLSIQKVRGVQCPDGTLQFYL